MAENVDTTTTPEAPAEPTTPAPPITSRFLFVEVAAQRAKQLRRGALPKIDRSAVQSHKLERVAMEEVRQGAIHYTLPSIEEVLKGRKGQD